MKIATEIEAPRTIPTDKKNMVMTGLSQVIDTLVSHFDQQIDTLWDRLVQERKAELATIDNNFKSLRDSMNKLIEDSNKSGHVATPRQVNSKNSNSYDGGQSMKRESSQKTTHRCLSYRSDYSQRNMKTTGLVSHRSILIKELDQENSVQVLEETKEQIKKQNQQVKQELTNFLFQLSQQEDEKIVSTRSGTTTPDSIASLTITNANNQNKINIYHRRPVQKSLSVIHTPIQRKISANSTNGNVQVLNSRRPTHPAQTLKENKP